MAEGKAQEPTRLNIGDSIGLFALLFAVIAFIFTPPAWLKVALLLAATAGIAIALRFSHWTHGWNPAGKIALWITATAALLFGGIRQIDQQLETDHRQTLTQLFSRGIRAMTRLMSRPWPQRVLWVFVGALLMLVFQVLLLAAKAYTVQRTKSHSAEKGMLDFKLQAETAMTNLTPVINSIAEVANEVANMLGRQTNDVKAASAMPTPAQLRVVSETARKLDHCSRRMAAKCSRLEIIGKQAEEGISGLFRWANAQPATNLTTPEVLTVLKQFSQSLERSLMQTMQYIAILNTCKGISREMNAALDGHIEIVTRIHNANANILTACLSALQAARHSTTSNPVPQILPDTSGPSA